MRLRKDGSLAQRDSEVLASVSSARYPHNSAELMNQSIFAEDFPNGPDDHAAHENGHARIPANTNHDHDIDTPLLSKRPSPSPPTWEHPNPLIRLPALTLLLLLRFIWHHKSLLIYSSLLVSLGVYLAVLGFQGKSVSIFLLILFGWGSIGLALLGRRSRNRRERRGEV